MAQIGITIVKSTAFRDSVQEFSNTYHYGAVGPNPSESRALQLIDELVAIEKTLHSTLVTFVRARLWSSGGTIAENKMIAQKALSGQGTQSTTTAMDKERAYLIQWNAGLDNRGRQVRLKKWFHSCGFIGGHSLDDGIKAGTTGFSNADRGTIATKVDAVTRLGIGVEEYGLVAESGRQRDGGNPVAHKYLEHHQLGDQWRG
jgi:hypothetical protein